MSHLVRMKQLFTRGRPSKPAKSQVTIRSRPQVAELESRDVPATFIWDGEAGNGNWTVGLNWNTNIAPNPAGGDDLVFPLGAAVTTVNNDFVDAKFQQIAVNAAYTFNGNGLELTNPGQVYTADTNTGTVTVNLPLITFTGSNPSIRTNQTDTDLVFSTNTRLEIGPTAGSLTFSSESTGNDRLLVGGSIAGTGDVIKVDSGRLIFSPVAPTSNNSYSGITFVREGILELSGTGNGVTTIPGNIEVGDNNNGTGVATLTQTQNDQIGDTAIVTVRGDGIYDLGTLTERIGGLVLGSSIGGGQVTGTGLLELNGNLTVQGDPSVGSKIAPDMTLLTPTTTFNVPESDNDVAGPDLLITGSIGAASNVLLVIDGGGRTQFEAVNTGGFTTAINDGIVILNKDAGAGGGGTIPGDLRIGDGVGIPGCAEVRIQQSNSINDNSLVTINGDGILTTSAVNFATDRIAALSSDSTDAKIALGIFSLEVAPPAEFVYNGQVSGNGQIRLVAPAISLTSRQTFSGPINLSGLGYGQFSLSNTGGPILEVTGPVTGGGGGLSTTSKLATDEIYSSSVSQRIQIFAGDNFYPGTFTSPGPATTGDVDLSGTFITRIADPAVFGSLTVTGDVTSLGDLRIELPGTFRPSVGEAFEIMDITDPSVRLALFGSPTFTGLPEGGRLFDTTGTVEFEITYAGGDGNDVFLINTGAPTVVVRRAGDQRRRRPRRRYRSRPCSAARSSRSSRRA